MAAVESWGHAVALALPHGCPVGSCSSAPSAHCDLARELEWPSDIVLGQHRQL